jgi:hypothetical protein
MVPILKEHIPQNIFNVDETALFYNGQPKRKMKIKEKTYHGGKKYKDRLLC